MGRNRPRGDHWEGASDDANANDSLLLMHECTCTMMTNADRIAMHAGLCWNPVMMPMRALAGAEVMRCEGKG